jgi:ribosomal protein S18 acetylase RimI-like enzyme
MACLRFEPASFNQLPALLELFEAARAWHMKLNVNPWPPFEATLIEKDIADAALFALIEDDRLIGTVTIYDSDPLIWSDKKPAYYIHRLATARECMGRGIGSRIVAEVERLGKDAGKQSLRLDCWADNEKLKRYYESLNFVRLHDVFTPEIPSLPAHYWNCTATLFERHISF